MVERTGGTQICRISLALQLITTTFAVHLSSSDIDGNAMVISEGGVTRRIEHPAPKITGTIIKAGSNGMTIISRRSRPMQIIGQASADTTTRQKQVKDDILKHVDISTEGDTSGEVEIEREYLEVDGKFEDKRGNKVEPFHSSENGVFITSDCGKKVSKIHVELPRVIEIEGSEKVEEEKKETPKPRSLEAFISFLAVRESKNKDEFEVKSKPVKVPNVVSAQDLSTFVWANNNYIDQKTGQIVNLYHDYRDMGLFIVYKNGDVVKRYNRVENSTVSVECVNVPEKVWKKYNILWKENK